MPHPYGQASRVPAEGPVSLSSLVPGAGPCDLEIGFGRAHFLLGRAQAEPGRRLLGLEVRLKWVVLAERAIAARGLPNVRAYFGDARQVLPRLEGQGLFETVFAHFPDPWWKRRHEHRRIVAADMLLHFHRLLVPGGLLFVQTDVPERADGYRVLLDAAPETFRRERAEVGGDSPFGVLSHREKKCLEAGLPVHRLWYRRRVG